MPRSSKLIIIDNVRKECIVELKFFWNKEIDFVVRILTHIKASHYNEKDVV